MIFPRPDSPMLSLFLFSRSILRSFGCFDLVHPAPIRSVGFPFRCLLPIVIQTGKGEAKRKTLERENRSKSAEGLSWPIRRQRRYGEQKTLSARRVLLGTSVNAPLSKAIDQQSRIVSEVFCRVFRALHVTGKISQNRISTDCKSHRTDPEPVGQIGKCRGRILEPALATCTRKATRRRRSC